jgi:hypothetical protein
VGVGVTDLERFGAKYEPEPNSGCWIWTARIQPNGYGQATLPGGHGSSTGAHRVSWLLHRGLIPVGLCVLHRCDNKPCVNPAHLYIGTLKQNSNDRDERGRANTCRGERHGQSKLTSEDVVAIRRRHAAGEFQRVIADDYGICQSEVSSVVCGRLWAWLQ